MLSPEFLLNTKSQKLALKRYFRAFSLLHVQMKEYRSLKTHYTPHIMLYSKLLLNERRKHNTSRVVSAPTSIRLLSDGELVKQLQESGMKLCEHAARLLGGYSMQTFPRTRIGLFTVGEELVRVTRSSSVLSYKELKRAIYAWGRPVTIPEMVSILLQARECLGDRLVLFPVALVIRTDYFISSCFAWRNQGMPEGGRLSLVHRSYLFTEDTRIACVMGKGRN